MLNESLIVIPARMASSRFPNKPLVKIAGVSMIERVWRIGCAVKNASRVVIATDSGELRDFVASFGAEVVMTSSSCRTGTDRVAEVASAVGDQFGVIFSLQGDAVLTPPWVIEPVLSEMLVEDKVKMATPAVKLTGDALMHFVAQKRSGVSSGTSVVFKKNRDALYFSKGLIPFSRDGELEKSLVFRHIGLYAYRRDVLLQLAALEDGYFERIEKLEQLRALENGIDIRVVLVDYQGRTHASVDRPEDVTEVEEIIRREGELVI